MSDFTKTIIVDASLPYETTGEFYKTIDNAAFYFRDNNLGGTIIVEAGEYIINGDTGKGTIAIPSNVTVIGRGNVIVKVTDRAYSAFKNANAAGNSRITISGFNIVLSIENADAYSNHLIYMLNVSDSIIEKITIDAPDSENTWGVNPESFAILFNADGAACTGNVISQCVIKNYGRSYTPHPGTGQYLINFGIGIGLSANSSSDSCTGNIIRNNYVTNCLCSCYVHNAQCNIITGNVFSKSYSYPNIMVEKSTRLVISGNQIIETTGYWNSDTSTLYVSHGVYLSGTKGCTVRGNVVSENGEHGIKTRFASDLTANQNNTIMGNVCYHNGIGIPGHSTNGVGIFLQGKTEYLSIMGNTVYNNTGCGIRVQANDEDEYHNVYPAIQNLVMGNVAVLHSTPGSDLAIGIDDSSVNTAVQNVENTLP